MKLDWRCDDNARRWFANKICIYGQRICVKLGRLSCEINAFGLPAGPLVRLQLVDWFSNMFVKQPCRLIGCRSSTKPGNVQATLFQRCQTKLKKNPADVLQQPCMQLLRQRRLNVTCVDKSAPVYCISAVTEYLQSQTNPNSRAQC
jgi:hypothetical protein